MREYAVVAADMEAGLARVANPLGPEFVVISGADGFDTGARKALDGAGAKFLEPQVARDTVRGWGQAFLAQHPEQIPPEERK